MSALFKLAPPGGETFPVPGAGRKVHGWRKAITVGGDGGLTYKDWDGTVKEKQQPPLAPSRFAEPCGGWS